MTGKIAIIGGGNLGKAICEGLIKSGYLPEKITVTRNKIERLNDLKEKGVFTLKDNREAVKNAEVIIFAVKPYNILEIVGDLTNYIKEDQILVSVVSGITTDQIKETVKANNPIIKAMPNTAISVQESITCIAASKETSQDSITKVEQIFQHLGKTTIIQENLMNAATVLGACGIAYVLRFIRAMIQGGIEIGFDSKTANLIADQTVKGAAELLLQNGNHPEQEIDKVTTPKGCTIAGLNEMEHQGFSSSLIKGVRTSFNQIENS